MKYGFLILKKSANLRGIPQNSGEWKFLKNRESVKSADIETADIGDPLYWKVKDKVLNDECQLV